MAMPRRATHLPKRTTPHTDIPTLQQCFLADEIEQTLQTADLLLTLSIVTGDVDRQDGHANENADDRDDDEQLEQSEAARREATGRLSGVAS